jgi:hypothetical protein
MKFKWRYTMVPACISFGPFFVSNMGGLGTGWVIPMLGAIMLTVGLSIMMSQISDLHQTLNGILGQRGPESNRPPAPSPQPPIPSA